MKALTIHQPYASLIAVGAKRIETRSWGTSYRGPVAIHAGRSMGAIADVYDDPLFGRPLAEGGYRTWGDLPLGEIVAIAMLNDCIQIERYGIPDAARGTAQPNERWFGDFSRGRCLWLLSNVRRLPEPIPCRGAQGLWTVPDDIVAQITEQIGAVA